MFGKIAFVQGQQPIPNERNDVGLPDGCVIGLLQGRLLSEFLENRVSDWIESRNNLYFIKLTQLRVTLA